MPTAVIERVDENQRKKPKHALDKSASLDGFASSTKTKTKLS